MNFCAEARLPDLQCAVCKQRGHGCHFGVVACRPCAAFFRRCIAENRSYKCLRGTNNCDIRRDGQRNACKACRLRLCRLAGMLYNPEKSENGADNGGGMAGGGADDGAVGGVQQQQQQKAKLEVQPVLNTNPPLTPALDRLVRANDAFIAGQRSLFMALHPEAAFDNMMMVIPKHAEFVKMSQGTKPLLFAMLNDGVEPFSVMEHTMKLALLESTLTALTLLHACHLTVDHFAQPGDTRYVTAVGHMLNSALLEQWASSDGQYGPAEYLRIKKPLLDSWFTFIDSFRRFPIKVLQRDFCALSVITLWNIAQHQFDTMEESWKEHKETIFAEWLADLGVRTGGGVGRQQQQQHQEQAVQHQQQQQQIAAAPALHLSRFLCTLVQLNSITTSLEEVSTILRFFQPHLHATAKAESNHWIDQ